MSDFHATWALARQRFDDIVKDLSTEQLQWVPFPGAVSAGKMAIHLAGVEVSFCSQLAQKPVDGLADKVRQASTDGIVNDLPFPFSDQEITSELVAEALKIGRDMAGPMLEEDSVEIRAREIKSALGPMVSGVGAFARLAQHPAYHQGQVYQLRQMPGFPQA